MPEHLKALTVILLVSSAICGLFFRGLIRYGVPEGVLRTRIKTYFIITVGFFLASNFWIAMAFLAVVCFWAAKKESNPIALYTFLILTLPYVKESVSGLGLLGHFVEIFPARLMSLVILLPLAFHLLQNQKIKKDKFSTVELFQIGYFGLLFFLTLGVGSLLGVVRGAFVYPILDAVLLLFVAARTLKTEEKLWDFLGMLLLATFILAALGVFESVWKWLLFSRVKVVLLGYEPALTSYLMRDESLLRAMASTDHSIVLGYLVMLGTLTWVGSFGRIQGKLFLVGLVILIGGAISTVSRGPWVGTAVGLIVLALISSSRSKIQTGFVGLSVLILPILIFTSFGEKLVSYLPFVGSVETETIDYRHSLIDIAINVISHNPFFGAYDYFLRPEIEALRQGQGIIDIVNTYVGVALYSGLVGLFLFVGPFVIAFKQTLMIALSKVARADGFALIPQILCACIVSVAVTIYTVSLIGTIGPMIWILLGATVACYKAFNEK